MRLKRRVDVGELGHSLPRPRQTGERRRIAVVQERVCFAAQPPKLVGAAENPPRGVEFLVFSGTQPGTLELSELKRQEIETRGFFALVHFNGIALCLQPFPFLE